MSVPNVKPSEFIIYRDGGVEHISYDANFDLDFDHEDETDILFGAEADLNCDDIGIHVNDFTVYFSLSDILEQGIAQVDAEEFSDDKELLIGYLLPILKKTVAELEKRQEALKK